MTIIHVLPWSLWLSLVIAVLVAVALATRRPLGVIAILVILALAVPRSAVQPAPIGDEPTGIEQGSRLPAVGPRTEAPRLTLPAAIGTGPARLAEAGDPNPSPVLRGIASWYRVPGLTAAAGPALRHALGDWRGAVVTVTANGSTVTVRLTDWCQCHRGERSERLIDLSDGAFSRLEPLAVGLVRVRVRAVTPPETDTP